MSNDWQHALRQKLQKDKQPRIAVVGIGHELRGDDAVGVWVARGLKPLLSAHAHLLVLDAGHVPENQTSTLRRFAPDLVLLVDAATLDAPAGTIRYLAWQDTSGLSASTHTLPLYLLAYYLTHELGCEVTLIGIQPANLDFSEGLSSEVQQAAEQIIQGLSEVLIPPL